ncbi:hypothetical protein BDR05DRAFT_1003289 [Suillus weaverae]|nr:hypothetical protein BDR05DRAFT_1003289 [Suillus weaverae]
MADPIPSTEVEQFVLDMYLPVHSFLHEFALVREVFRYLDFLPDILTWRATSTHTWSVGSGVLYTRFSLHRRLRLTEILEMIFRLVFDAQFIEPVFNEYHSPEPAILLFPNTEGRRSVLNLALTCQKPQGLKAQPNELVLSPRPSPVHTPKLFVLYAARVQILFNQNFRVDDSAYALLLASAPKDAPLFPKLR